MDARDGVDGNERLRRGSWKTTFGHPISLLRVSCVTAFLILNLYLVQLMQS